MARWVTLDKKQIFFKSGFSPNSFYTALQLVLYIVLHLHIESAILFKQVYKEKDLHFYLNIEDMKYFQEFPFSEIKTNGYLLTCLKKRSFRFVNDVQKQINDVEKTKNCKMILKSKNEEVFLF